MWYMFVLIRLCRGDNAIFLYGCKQDIDKCSVLLHIVVDQDIDKCSVLLHIVVDHDIDKCSVLLHIVVDHDIDKCFVLLHIVVDHMTQKSHFESIICQNVIQRVIWRCQAWAETLILLYTLELTVCRFVILYDYLHFNWKGGDLRIPLNINMKLHVCLHAHDRRVLFA